MLSDKKNFEIANVCYANVSGNFATFCNPKYRGPNFTWEWFIEDCEKSAVNWMHVHHVKGDKKLVDETAKKYAKEIAEHLVRRLNE